MHTSSVLLTLALATTYLTQSTAQAISEISDGQIQAPSSIPSTSSSELSMSSSIPYTNGFTSFTTETNSAGVITGMPSVVTSQPTQPAVVTSQPSISYPVGWNGTSTSTTATSAAPVSSSSVTASFTVPSGSSSGTGTSTASPSVGSGTSGAVANQVAGAGVALLFAGSLFSIFL